MSKIRRCGGCGAYTLSKECPVCEAETGPAAPARFSPEDPYGDQRRKLKRMEGRT